MLRLRRFTPPFSALFALWFAAVLGDPGVLHSCPMHSAHGATASMHAEHAAHTGAVAHGSTRAEHGTPDGQHERGSGPCTCVGHCCAATAIAPLAIAPALCVPVEILTTRTTSHPARSVPRAVPALRLPFANGPPAV